MTNSPSGDLITVLRHLVENVQWGGNQGAKSETQDALDRLTSDDYPEPDAPETPETPETPVTPGVNTKDPDVSGGSRPTTSRSGSSRK